MHTKNNLLTARLFKGRDDAIVSIGNTYNIDPNDTYWYTTLGCKIKVIAGPHSDYGPKNVYTCETLTKQEVIPNLPFHNYTCHRTCLECAMVQIQDMSS